MLTVDDDPALSRAVARDLRRRYGEEYQIVRASSGHEALDALREIKLRGGRVAVMLADYRMPQLSGIEFLEHAMDLFPHARRALLTAYADTDAAIQAINVVDVDPYLLKSWAPPAAGALPPATADTGAGTQAINVVALDHNLLKPWGPPEEKLYPVTDALI